MHREFEIEAIASKENISSKRLLEKLGLKGELYFVSYYYDSIEIKVLK